MEVSGCRDGMNVRSRGLRVEHGAKEAVLVRENNCTISTDVCIIRWDSGWSTRISRRLYWEVRDKKRDGRGGGHVQECVHFKIENGVTKYTSTMRTTHNHQMKSAHRTQTFFIGLERGIIFAFSAPLPAVGATAEIGARGAVGLGMLGAAGFKVELVGWLTRVEVKAVGAP